MEKAPVQVAKVGWGEYPKNFKVIETVNIEKSLILYYSCKYHLYLKE